MKVTVELSGSDLKDICRITGERKKGPAIRKLVIDALNLQRRREIDEKFLSGEWGLELKGFEEARAADRAKARDLAARWRK